MLLLLQLLLLQLLLLVAKRGLQQPVCMDEENRKK